MNRYITTPIYYASGSPHLGHAYTSLVADSLKRFHASRGDSVKLITGTDEHGQKIERAAAAHGLEPRVFVEQKSLEFQQALRRLDVDYDHFVRTTSEAHVPVVKDFWERLVAAGDVYLGRYEGAYCVDCEQYFHSQGGEIRRRAAQQCPVHLRPLEHFSEESYFFRLSRYQDAIREHIQSHRSFIRPEVRRNEVLGFLNNNQLRDLSISRTSTSWGIPVPGDEKHVMYVWVDALVSYLSALGGLESDEHRTYWPNTTHLIGKDILTFHAVYWPGLLLSAGIPLPKQILVNGWLTVDGRKIAKSDASTLVDLRALTERVGSDSIRYYFLKSVPYGQDVDFSLDKVIAVANADIANNLGNLVSRTVALIHRFYDGGFETAGVELGKTELILQRVLDENFRESVTRFEAADFAGSIRLLIGTVSRLNRYIQEKEPWTLLKDESKREDGKTIFKFLHQSLEKLTRVLAPVIPITADRIRRQLGFDQGSADFVRVAKVEPVFPRIEIK